MQIKRYTARDMTRAVRRVRQELGPDAVILDTCRLDSGEVEVSAAVERRAEEPAGQGRPAAGQAQPAAGPGPPAAAEPSGPSVSALARRVESLSGLVSRHLVLAEAAAGFGARPEVAPLYHHLAGQEVEPEAIGEILGGLSSPEGRGLVSRLAIRLKKALEVAPGLKLVAGRPVVWALVGPTGAGKTTTVAKLAATFALQQGLKVGMITVDTFRVAAAEQLMVYGRIMEVPTRVAAGGEELVRALEELKGCDLVLVDTVGRSPADEESLEELAGILAAAPAVESHLVIAAPTRERDQKEVAAAFGRFRPASLIFTKLDETATFGPILNRVRDTGLPVSYLATGQRVPDDLEEATRDGLARRLLPPSGQVV
jgi:flagellar biosynthesis protein FlhF